MTTARELGALAYGKYPDLTGVRRVLVVMLRHLGDTLLSGPVFSTLKADLPDVKVDALVYAATAEVLRGHPAVHEVLPLDQGWRKLSFFQRWRAELGLMRDVRRRGYDLVINLTEGDRGAIAAAVSGARLRVGVDPGRGGFFGKRGLYTHLAGVCPTPRHSVERHLDVLRCIGLFPAPEQRRLTLTVDAAAEQRVRGLLAEAQIDPQRCLVIHPASRWRFKCWPMDRVIRAADELGRQGWSLVITTSPDPVEIAMAAEIERGVKHARLLNLAGKTGVAELAALLGVSRGLLTVDSLPLHMASALRTPVVALFGPSSDATWGPWMHARSRVVTQDYSCRPCQRDGCAGSKVSDCLMQLPETAVLQALREVVGQPGSY